jgi:hypothetical protein
MTPRHTLDLDAVRTHLHEARAVRTPAALWVAVADVTVLLAEIERLRSLLTLSRATYADLVAAGRATILADHDGDADPLLYLRDELDHQGRLPDRHVHPCWLLDYGQDYR